MASEGSMTGAAVSGSRIGPYLPLFLGPGLLVGAFITFARTDEIMAIVLLDRAKVQGLIGLPLVLAAPGVLSLGWRPPTRVLARRLTLLIGIGIAAVMALVTMASVTQLGCRPVASPLEVLPLAALVGAIAAAQFVLATLAARPKAVGSYVVPRSLLVGAAVGIGALAVDLAAIAVLFPPLSCAPFR